MEAKIISVLDEVEFREQLNKFLSSLAKDRLHSVDVSTCFDGNRGTVRYTATVIFDPEESGGFAFGSI